MISFDMESYKTLLIEKQQKYKHYHPQKFINMNILQVKK